MYETKYKIVIVCTKGSTSEKVLIGLLVIVCTLLHEWRLNLYNKKISICSPQPTDLLENDKKKGFSMM